MLTPYQYASNNPVANIDLDGLEGVPPGTPGDHEGQSQNTTTIEGTGPGGYGEVTREWVWHEGGVNGSKKGWMKQTEYFENVLKPLGKAYNNAREGGSIDDFNFYFNFANSRTGGTETFPLYLETIKQVGKHIKENPTYDSWDKWIPVWGSLQQARLDFCVSKYGWGTFNTVLGISDVFLVKSVVTGAFKGGLSAFTKNFSTWGRWRNYYGNSGFAEAGEHLHHWALPRDGAISGSGFGWRMINQKWNLLRMTEIKWLGLSGQQRHTLIHGGTIRATGLNWNNPLGAGLKYWYATPAWFKTGLNFGGGKLVNSLR